MRLLHCHLLIPQITHASLFIQRGQGSATMTTSASDCRPPINTSSTCVWLLCVCVCACASGAKGFFYKIRYRLFVHYQKTSWINLTKCFSKTLNCHGLFCISPGCFLRDYQIKEVRTTCSAKALFRGFVGFFFEQNQKKKAVKALYFSKMLGNLTPEGLIPSRVFVWLTTFWSYCYRGGWSKDSTSFKPTKKKEAILGFFCPQSQVMVHDSRAAETRV